MVTSPLEIRKPLRKTALRSYHDILIGGSAYKTTASRKRSLKELADFSFVSLSAGFYIVRNGKDNAKVIVK